MSEMFWVELINRFSVSALFTKELLKTVLQMSTQYEAFRRNAIELYDYKIKFCFVLFLKPYPEEIWNLDI